VAEDLQRSATRVLRAGTTPAARTLRALVTLVATGAYVGYTPRASGTAGSLLGLLLVKFVTAAAWRYSPAGSLVLFGVVFILGCGVADCAEGIFGAADSPMIVLDEILGMIATMFGNPTAWPWLIAGFTLFRLFDIIKPWPASWFNRMQGGVGVMLDDLAAACYANVTLQLLRRVV
jgi:phosphatidylglycerophosphatase A